MPLLVRIIHHKGLELFWISLSNAATLTVGTSSAVRQWKLDMKEMNLFNSARQVGELNLAKNVVCHLVETFCR